MLIILYGMRRYHFGNMVYRTLSIHRHLNPEKEVLQSSRFLFKKIDSDTNERLA